MLSLGLSPSQFSFPTIQDMIFYSDGINTRYIATATEHGTPTPTHVPEATLECSC